MPPSHHPSTSTGQDARRCVRSHMACANTQYGITPFPSTTENLAGSELQLSQ